MNNKQQTINLNNKTKLVTSAVGFICFNLLINLLDFVKFLQGELINAKVLPADYDFEAHKELCHMPTGDVQITFADFKSPLTDYDFITQYSF